MVEVHRTGWETPPTVRAGSVAEVIKHPRMPPPRLALSHRRARCICYRCRSRGVPFLGSDPVAVRANNVAFRCFCAEHWGRPKHGAALSKAKQLGRPFAMIEVHLVRRERPTAVAARSRPKFAEQLDRSVLSDADASDLAVAISPVVGDIR